MGTSKRRKTPYYLDQPIEQPKEDALARDAFVNNFIHILTSQPYDTSVVFAIQGTWGTGKTSVKNLITHELNHGRQTAFANNVLEFNPWAHSGKHQILDAFFHEISSHLGKSHPSVEAKLLELRDYIKLPAYALPAFQSYVSADTATLGAISTGLIWLADKLRRKPKVRTRGAIKDDLRKNLQVGNAKSHPRLLVILDDVDRLLPSEIVELFQLVKINTDLPNIHYLFLFDRNVIQKHLEDQKLDKEFLDKIIQCPLSLPSPTTQEIHQYLNSQIATLLPQKTGQPLFDWQPWELMFSESLRHILITLRDIKRLLSTLRFHVTLLTVNGKLEVNPLDLCLIEVLRVFKPEVHDKLHNLKHTLFWNEHNVDFRMLEQDQNHLNSLVSEIAKDVDNNQKKPVEAIAKFILPQIEQAPNRDESYEHAKQRRLCDPNFFDLYFQLKFPSNHVSQREIQHAITTAQNPGALLKKLSRIQKAKGWQSVLQAIQLNLDHVVKGNCTKVLAGLWLFLWELLRQDNTQNYESYFASIIQVIVCDHIPKERLDEYLLEAHESEKTLLGLMLTFKQARRQPGKQLKSKVASELKQTIIRDSFFKGKRLRVALNFLQEHEGATKLQGWIHHQTQNGPFMADVLEACGAVKFHTTSGADPVLPEFVLSKSMLE